MKYIYLIIIIFIFPIALISQWEEIGEKNGIKYYNSGITWIKFDSDNSDNLIAVAATAVFYSTDNGESWKFINHPLFQKNGGFSIAVKSNIFFIADRDSSFVSFNYGETWTKRINKPYFRILNVDKYLYFYGTQFYDFQFIGNLLYCSFEDGVAVSKNYGDTWEPVSGPNNSQPLSIIFKLVVKDSVLLVGGSMGFQYTTNHGDKWSEINYNLKAFDVLGLLLLDNRIIIYSANFDKKLLSSTDLGKSWSVLYNSDTKIFRGYNDRLNSCNNVIYFQDEFGIIKYSNDLGISWDEIPEGYNPKKTSNFNVNEKYFFVGTFSTQSYGMLRYPLENCLPRPVSAPEYIKLPIPPYPNPAAGIITFELPEGSGISGSYEVYNELGEKFSPSCEFGAGKLSLDASSLPIGVYVLKYVSGSRLISEKFMVRR